MNVDRWRFVASGLPPETPSVRRCAHGAWARRHIDIHPRREILVVLSGGGYQSLCGKSYPARTGTVFLFDAMEPHDARYPPNHPPAMHLWLHLMSDRCGIHLLRVKGGRSSFKIVWQRWHDLSELGLSSAEALFPGKAPVSPPETVRQRCRAALALLIANLAQKGYEPLRAEPQGGFQAGIMQTLVRHIDESHGRGCRLESLARIAGYNKYHFLRLFQKHTGMSLRKCVDDARAQAFRKMTAGGTRQRAIATELGFAYPSALCRWRRRMGL